MFFRTMCSSAMFGRSYSFSVIFSGPCCSYVMISSSWIAKNKNRDLETFFLRTYSCSACSPDLVLFFFFFLTWFSLHLLTSFLFSTCCPEFVLVQPFWFSRSNPYLSCIPIVLLFRSGFWDLGHVLLCSSGLALFWGMSLELVLLQPCCLTLVFFFVCSDIVVISKPLFLFSHVLLLGCVLLTFRPCFFFFQSWSRLSATLASLTLFKLCFPDLAVV